MIFSLTDKASDPDPKRKVLDPDYAKILKNLGDLDQQHSQNNYLLSCHREVFLGSTNLHLYTR
jgi:hypothetical protein